jgi:RNase P subunit RPR2
MEEIKTENKEKEAYCVHCHKKTKIIEYNKVEFETSRGKKAKLVGKCGTCGTAVQVFVKV